MASTILRAKLLPKRNTVKENNINVKKISDLSKGYEILSRQRSIDQDSRRGLTAGAIWRTSRAWLPLVTVIGVSLWSSAVPMKESVAARLIDEQLTGVSLCGRPA
jgi:hypothetical protein